MRICWSLPQELCLDIKAINEISTVSFQSFCNIFFANSHCSEPQWSTVNSVNPSKAMNRSIHMQKISIIRYRQKGSSDKLLFCINRKTCSENKNPILPQATLYIFTYNTFDRYLTAEQTATYFNLLIFNLNYDSRF